MTSFIEKQRVLFSILMLVVIATVLYMFRNTGLIVDESENYPQIINFTNGDFRLLEISAMPGYHALMACLSKLTGLSTIFALRCLTVIFGILSVVFFFKLSNRTSPGQAVIRTIQFFFFPAIFIYFFMMYTDILSLLLVIIMFLFAHDKRFILAGIFGILSMLVRQNNVIWMAFIPVLMYYQTYGFKVSWSNFINVAKKSWVFNIGFLLFVIFVFINGGVAIGDTSKHPAFMFSAGNVVFILFCFFLFFLPLQIANIPKVFRYFKTNLWAIPISLILAAIYWFTFKSDHPYNQIETHYFLRNLVLTRFTASPGMKIIFFLPVIYAFWSLVVTELWNKAHYFLYLFAFLFLVPSWLIEQRYYMIPFMLFMVFRKDQPLWVEYGLILFYIAILIWLMPLIVSIKAFL